MSGVTVRNSVDISRLEKRITRLRREMRQAVNTEFPQIGQRVLEHIQSITPEKTGQARKGWIMQEHPGIRGYANGGHIIICPNPNETFETRAADQTVRLPIEVKLRWLNYGNKPRMSPISRQSLKSILKRQQTGMMPLKEEGAALKGRIRPVLKGMLVFKGNYGLIRALSVNTARPNFMVQRTRIFAMRLLNAWKAGLQRRFA